MTVELEATATVFFLLLVIFLLGDEGIIFFFGDVIYIVGEPAGRSAGGGLVMAVDW